jgi:tyrosyl-tRNA synthetase
LKRDVESGKNPRDVKFLLAEEIITRFHSADQASKAQAAFIARFPKGAMPDEIPEVELSVADGDLGIANLLKDAALVSSTSDAMRMIRQGAVKIDGERIEDTRLRMTVGTAHVYQVGKRRFARVKLGKY